MGPHTHTHNRDRSMGLTHEERKMSSRIGRSEQVCGAVKKANPGYEPEHMHIRARTHKHTHSHTQSGTVTFRVEVA